MNKDALTAPEVAGILKVAQNTVYELVKRGELNCYKVGRKMRFTYEDVQEYIQRSKNISYILKKSPSSEQVLDEKATDRKIPSGAAGRSQFAGTEAFRLCGHDEILDVLAKYMTLKAPGIGIERIHKGSYDSLSALYKEQVTAAASHMWDGRTDTYNLPYIEKMLPGCPVILIHLAKRSQGFFVAQGNPKGISSWEDLRRPDLRLANRELGAGTRILLDEHLLQMGIDGDGIWGYQSQYLSHMSVAGSISKGEADFGIGTEKTALNMRGVDFVPLQMEEYDLVVKKQNLKDERVQLMLQILQSESFREQFQYMNGYDVSEMGKIVEER